MKSDAASLTIFANFRIDSEERLLRMKDSFNSFRDANIEKWVINVRGPLKKEAIGFLRENLGHNLVSYELETGKGWFHDTNMMLPSITSRLVMFWIEDHIFMQTIDDFNCVIQELDKASVEYFQYSWLANGLLPAQFSKLDFEETDKLLYLNYGLKENQIRQQSCKKLYGREYYIISVCGIFSVQMFKRILSKRDPIYRRWPKETPFDFEKRSYDVHWLPMKIAVPKQEFFAQIDDDNGIEGSSLQSRGLYPVRVVRKDINFIDELASEKKALSNIRNISWLNELYQNSFILKKLSNYLKRLPYQF